METRGLMDRRKERDRARRKWRKDKEADERHEKWNRVRKPRSDDLMEAWCRNHPSENRP